MKIRCKILIFVILSNYFFRSITHARALPHLIKNLKSSRQQYRYQSYSIHPIYTSRNVDWWRFSRNWNWWGVKLLSLSSFLFLSQFFLVVFEILEFANIPQLRSIKIFMLNIIDPCISSILLLEWTNRLLLSTSAKDNFSERNSQA